MTYQPEPTLIEFFHYNHWANQQLMTICMQVDEAVVNAPIAGAYGSILDTFAHILRAEASFLKRIHGIAPEPPFKWENHPSLEQMAAYETTLGVALLDTLRGVPATQNVHEEGDGWRFDYQARLIFMSVVYHGIAHRTDITTALNNSGVDLPELDVWGYQSAYPERFQAKATRFDA
jgi:uncharacterized damage-inducible protein DinB